MKKKKPRYNYRRMKQIYNLINTGRDATEAEICLKLNLEFRTGRQKVRNDINNLCNLGFLITENSTENNTWYGVLDSQINEVLYEEYLEGA